jgi:hypothetical protein
MCHLHRGATVCYPLSSFSVLFPDSSSCFVVQGCFLPTPVGLKKVCLSSSWHYGHARLLTVPTSATELPIHEDRPHSGSLFASRTLPPLCPHPYPRPQPYSLLRPSEWSSSSYRRDGDEHLRRLQFQGYDQPLYPILPSPLATSSSEDGHDQQ